MDRLAKFADADEIMNSADEERMKSDFCNVLSRMRCCEETLLVINDIDYITSGRAEYLQWLPVKTEGNLRIICSSSDADIVSNAQLLQWQMLTLRPMDKESSRRILTSELRKLGKNPADALRIGGFCSPAGSVSISLTRNRNRANEGHIYHSEW